MTDQGFPFIEYQLGKSYREWGCSHGEEFRLGIKELVEIRKKLMLSKNPALEPKLEGLAHLQWEATHRFAPDIGDELAGIAEGANVSVEDIVILNNYTDFRDLELSEEGCSTIYTTDRTKVLAGQTWDMHKSAKNYVSVISVPEHDGIPGALLFSLVGCVGMMGVNTKGALVGVNNINTKNARAGIKWPVLVRKLLHFDNRHQIVEVLQTAPVTSGHNYLIADKTGGEHWEVTPEVSACAMKSETPNIAYGFHTNHCLTKEVSALEDKNSLSSTTFDRYSLLDKKMNAVKSFDDMLSLLTNHDNYPKSICSHFETSGLDPSSTCGGGVGDLNAGLYIFWRGCPVHDKNYVEYRFELDCQKFKRV